MAGWLLAPSIFFYSNNTFDFEILGVACSQSGQTQLAQSVSINLDNAGRVEICMGGVWGTIAADSVATPWSEKNCTSGLYSTGIQWSTQCSLPENVINSNPHNVLLYVCMH